MSKIRKQYGLEFKVIAIELSRGRPDLSVLAKKLKIRPALLLYQWRKELETKAGTVFPDKAKHSIRRGRPRSTTEKRTVGHAVEKETVGITR